MGRSSNRILTALAVSIALMSAGGLTPRAGAAPRGPGSLDPSFSEGGRVFAQPVAVDAASEFSAAAREPNGDLVLESRHAGSGDESVREIQLRTPSGALVPTFGDGGRVTIEGEGGSGVAVLSDGGVLVGTTMCGGTSSMAEMLDPSGGKVASFGKAGCGPEAGFTPSLVTVDPQGRALISGTGTYCPPCGKDDLRQSQLDVVRLLPDGSLDPGFGKEGFVGTHTSLGLEGQTYSEPIAQAGIGATTEGGVVFAAGSHLIRLEPDGSPDPSYGKGGIAPAPAGSKALVVEADGAVTAVTSDSQRGQTVSRLTPTGVPDPSFGTAGTLALSPRIESSAEVIAPSSGGGYLIGGSEAPDPKCRTCEDSPYLERITASGQPDPSYGKNGIATLDLPLPPLPKPFTQRALVVGPDGSAVVVGGDYHSDALALALSASGAPEESFGTSGALVDHRDAQVQLEPTGLALTPGGGLTLMNQRFGLPGIPTGFQVKFDGDGRQLRRPGGATAVETLSHGAIAPVGARGVAIWEGNDPRSSHALPSAAADGRPIEGYGKKGRAKFPEGFIAEAVVSAPGGGLLAVGVLEHKTMAAFRIGPDGRPQRGFGHAGLATVEFSGRSIAYGGLVEADGDVVLTGTAAGHFVAARLLPDGRPDPRYGREGRVRGLRAGNAAGDLIAPAGKGTVIVTLKVENSRYVSAGLLRLDSRGRLVRGFGKRGVARAVAERQPLALLSGGGRIVVVTDPRFEKGHGGGGVELRSYKPGGAVDRAFGKRGVRFFGAGSDEEHVFTPAAAVQQGGGNVVVAGTARDGRRSKAELVRFLLR